MSQMSHRQQYAYIPTLKDSILCHITVTGKFIQTEIHWCDWSKLCHVQSWNHRRPVFMQICSSKSCIL